MEEKEFLNRIAERLGRARTAEGAMRPRAGRGIPDFAKPKGSASQEALALRFKEALEAVGGSVHIEAGQAAARARVEALISEWRPKNMLSWAKEEFEGFDLNWLLDGPGCKAWSPGLASGEDYKSLVMAADLGLTTASAGVASSGSLMLLAGPGRPRALSLTVSKHLALLRGADLVASLGEAMARTQAQASAMIFVTGPSRTSDIENDATIGVHGPAAVTVVIQL